MMTMVLWLTDACCCRCYSDHTRMTHFFLFATWIIIFRLPITWLIEVCDSCCCVSIGCCRLNLFLYVYCVVSDVCYSTIVATVAQAVRAHIMWMCCLLLQLKWDGCAQRKRKLFILNTDTTVFILHRCAHNKYSTQAINHLYTDTHSHNSLDSIWFRCSHSMISFWYLSYALFFLSFASIFVSFFSSLSSSPSPSSPLSS